MSSNGTIGICQPANNPEPPQNEWDQTKNASFCAIPLFANGTDETQIQRAFNICCAGAPIALYYSGCFAYCNISYTDNFAEFTTCMADNNGTEGSCWTYDARSAAGPGKKALGILGTLVLVGLVGGMAW